MTTNIAKTPAKRKRPGTAYDRGAALERRVMIDLERAGWLCFRSAGSHRCADVIALKDGVTWLVQVKRVAALNNTSWNRFYCAVRGHGGIPILASARPRQPILYEQIVGEKAPRSRLRPVQVVSPWPSSPSASNAEPASQLSLMSD